MSAINKPETMRKLRDALTRLRANPTRNRRYDAACQAFEQAGYAPLTYDLMLWIAERVINGGKPTVDAYKRERASPARQKGGHV